VEALQLGWANVTAQEMAPPVDQGSTPRLSRCAAHVL
jgi:hypothetical protein